MLAMGLNVLYVVYVATWCGTATEMPRNLIVVGAGVVGIEYAAMLGSLANTQVLVVIALRIVH
jgi:pyruvate/2-oxoglutarate dehydrogenase complex dihydrolipoamide dehydrogenase (E3) component